MFAFWCAQMFLSFILSLTHQSQRYRAFNQKIFINRNFSYSSQKYQKIIQNRFQLFQHIWFDWSYWSKFLTNGNAFDVCEKKIYCKIEWKHQDEMRVVEVMLTSLKEHINPFLNRKIIKWKEYQSLQPKNLKNHVLGFEENLLNSCYNIVFNTSDDSFRKSPGGLTVCFYNGQIDVVYCVLPSKAEADATLRLDSDYRYLEYSTSGDALDENIENEDDINEVSLQSAIQA